MPFGMQSNLLRDVIFHTLSLVIPNTFTNGDPKQCIWLFGKWIHNVIDPTKHPAGVSYCLFTGIKELITLNCHPSNSYRHLFLNWGRLKNAYELLNSRALNISTLYKIASCNVWVRSIAWNFKGTLWNSTQNILPIHWRCAFMHSWK